ncbi:MAG: ABC transporter permease [Gemmatimonadetes bacterium]|nr:ABC transporter permease [Gemmatimonadota bacterium]
MFRNYLTVILRNLLRHRGYLAINVLGLAIGIASCVLVMLYVQDELSYDQHHEKKDRIYRLAISETAGGKPDEWAMSPPPWAPVLASEFPEIEHFTRIKPPNTGWLVRYGDKRSYEKYFVFADSSVFDIFTIPLVQGNPETALAEPHTVVVSAAMVDKYFGDENPIGKVIAADDRYMFTVTGIMRDMPENSHFHADFLASFATMAVDGIYFEPTTMQDLSSSMYTYLLLKEGRASEDLEKKLPQFLERHVGEQLKSLGMEMRPFLQPLTDIHLHSHLKLEIEANSDIRYVYIFSLLAAFILLIACVNFMNLATARSIRRAQKVGIRKVLGAHRVHLIKQFMGESVFFSLIALIVALGSVHLLLPQFNQLSGKALEMDYQTTWLIPALGTIALFTGIAAGGYPALVLSSFRPVAVLSGESKAGVSQSFLRKSLITFQFIVSIIMIIGTGAVIGQVEYMRNKELGFDKEHVVVLRLPDREAVLGYPVFKREVMQFPEIVNVSSSASVPGTAPSLNSILPEGFSEDQMPLVATIWADFDFVETLDIELKSGRSFSRAFTSDNNAVVINETAARSFEWEDPIGKTFRHPGAPDTAPSRNVIGVVSDFHHQSLHQRIEPLIIMYWSEGRFMVVKLQGQNLSRGLEILHAQWRETYPDHPAMDFYFLDEDLQRQYVAEQRLGSVFVAGAVLSILIACMGLLGLASYLTEQRTREIGIRKVLGASISNVIVQLSGDFTKLILIAFAIGAPAGYFGMQTWLENFPYRIELSQWIFMFAGLAVLLITWLTVGYHTLKTATANPADALRAE